MSLDWNLSNIKDHETVCWIDDEEEGGIRMNPVTSALIWGTMSVGLGAITEKNLDEFVARFRVIERMHGGSLVKDGKPSYLTDEDFLTHVGLKTNVSNETRAQWARRIFVNKQTSDTESYARQFRRGRELRAKKVAA